ncbi:MAG: hypothetical protein JSR78_07225 [Proteobacteria bacterium]|nr:hypothetical protein [Pseudomonadota bacterium]
MARPRQQLQPVKKDGFRYFVQLVPPEYASVEPRKRVVNSTKIRITDDPRGVTAQAIVDRMYGELCAYWDAKRQGKTPQPPRYLEEAVQTAAQYQVPYLPADQLAEAGLDVLIDRLRLLRTPDAMNNELVFRGLLGGAEVPAKKENDILISQMTATVEKMEKIDLSKKSSGQLIKWRGSKDLAIRQFLAVCSSDKAIAEITRNDVVNFREQLQERILETFDF